MNGAIIYTSKYGSTARYAGWIGEATGLPVFDIESAPPVGELDFVVLGSPVIYYKLLIGDWARENLAALLARPVVFFSVSGAGPGAKLDGWLTESLPEPLVWHMDHVGLRGRFAPGDLSWFDRVMLLVAGLFNRDRAAGRMELHGFDLMDRASIGPVVEKVRALQARAAA